MLKACLLFLLFTLVVYVCLQNSNLKKRHKADISQDVEQVQRAARASLLAAHTVSPILALVDVLKAELYLNHLIEKHGTANMHSFPIDVESFLNTVRNQKKLIIADIMSQNSEIVPEGYFDVTPLT